MSASTGLDTSAPGRLEEIADGVFAYVQPDGTWMINNTGFLVARDGVTAIDACSTERRTRAFLDTIASVARLPVRTLVNTHHHPDHTAGNGLFTGVAIVAHHNAREEMRAFGVPSNTGIWTDVDYGDLTLALPTVTFADQLTLWAGDLRCELLFAGQPAHTTNDIVAWIPEHSVLFAGDLVFNGGTPFLLSGSVLGAIHVLENFLKPLGARTIVPGHGPVAGPGVIDEVLGYLCFVRDAAEQALGAGLSPLDAARGIDLGRYAQWSDPERIVGNLHRAYADLSGTEPQRGGPLDAAAALADMVAYNGGRPLRCRA
ncbi:MAG: MBL fold metallo-hydrolase [Nocardiopsaceae bacterium]|nr:MBL fold metallo-hydrolase [Nocardiopsaceae bacterium]